jgi:hypothetical protein
MTNSAAKRKMDELKAGKAGKAAAKQRRRIQKHVARAEAKPAKARKGAMQAGARLYPEPPFGGCNGG